MSEQAKERVRASQGQAKPVPPNNHIKSAGMHWMERIITDGIGDGLEVFQWQPGVQKWCRPNHYATYGNELDMSSYIYIGPCVLPVSGQEHDRLKALIQELDGANRLSSTCHSNDLRIKRDNYSFLRDLLQAMV